jgi:HEXXH motif-containing protein
MAVARRVVVFAAADADSFATPEAPGAVFLNPGPGAGAVFFVEELVHQGGHHVFHALTAEWERLLTVDRDMPFGTLSGESDDHRSVEVVLHGVFTQSLMCVALYACLEAEVFEGSRHRELLGRLSFAMKRLHLDLVDVRRRDLYTEAGEDLVIGFEEAFDEVFSRAGRLITGFDLTNQPYSFSYGCFAALNA